MRVAHDVPAADGPVARNRCWRAATGEWLRYGPPSAVTGNDADGDADPVRSGDGPAVGAVRHPSGRLDVRRLALLDVDGWDERLRTVAAAEADLCRRLEQRGWAVSGPIARAGAGPGVPGALADRMLLQRLHPRARPSRAPGSAAGRVASPARRRPAVPRRRRLLQWPDTAAVLFDRDGTLVHDVPYNGDPALVRPVPGALRCLRLLHRLRIRTAVVTNQSGVARGLLVPEQVAAVNARVDALLGPFGSWQVCPHGEGDGCDCRKPQPGMILAAAARLGVTPTRCVMIGDTGGDVLAALRAGARAVLVPTPLTRAEEVDAAPVVARDLSAAVGLALSGAV